jgi:hypothetical protein
MEDLRRWNCDAFIDESNRLRGTISMSGTMLMMTPVKDERRQYRSPFLRGWCGRSARSEPNIWLQNLDRDK